MSPNPPPVASLWSQYQELISLHKFYFEFIIKAAGYSFGTIGAVVVYVLKEKDMPPIATQLALVFPLLLSAGSALVFIGATPKAQDLFEQIRALQEKAKSDLPWRPHAELLVWMCQVFNCLFVGTFFGLLALICWPSAVHK